MAAFRFLGSTDDAADDPLVGTISVTGVTPGSKIVVLAAKRNYGGPEFVLGDISSDDGGTWELIENNGSAGFPHASWMMQAATDSFDIDISTDGSGGIYTALVVTAYEVFGYDSLGTPVVEYNNVSSSAISVTATSGATHVAALGTMIMSYNRSLVSESWDRDAGPRQYGHHYYGYSDPDTSTGSHTLAVTFDNYSRLSAQAVVLPLLFVDAPTNTVRPTFSATPTGVAGSVGTWDNKDNGILTYEWEVRDASDDSVLESGTSSTFDIDGDYSGPLYLWVASSNDGGNDSAQDQYIYAMPGLIDDCVGAWVTSFDLKGNGTATLYDYSGQNNHITLFNTPTWEADAGSGGTTKLTFNGTNQYGKGDLYDAVSDQNFSLSLYAKFPTITSGDYFLTLGSSVSNQQQIALYHSSATAIRVFYRDDAGDLPTSYTDMTATVTTDTWYHIYLEADGTKVRLYVDDTLVNILDRSTITAGSMTLDQIVLGSLGRISISNHGNVSLDSIYLFDRVLTSTERGNLASDREWLQSGGSPIPGGYGSVATEFGLLGTGSTSTAGYGSSIVEFSLDGVGSIAAAGAGSISTELAVVGQGATTTSGLGVIATELTLAGVGNTLFQGSGDIDTDVTVDGVGYTLAHGYGPIETEFSLTGFGGGQTGGSGSVSVEFELSGVGKTTAAGVGEIDAELSVTGIGYFVSYGSGSINSELQVVGVGVTEASGSGPINAIISVVGSGEISAYGYGLVENEIELVGVGSNIDGNLLFLYYHYLTN